MKWHPPALLWDLEMRERRKGYGLIYTPPKEGTGNSSPPLQREVQSALFSNTYISLKAQVNISKKCGAGHLLKIMCLPFHSHSLQLGGSQKLSQPWPKTGARLSGRQERVFPPRCSCRSAQVLAVGDRPIAFHKKNREAINPDTVYLLKKMKVITLIQIMSCMFPCLRKPLSQRK